jgi:L-ascorbate 6-phosphate lactonase
MKRILDYVLADDEAGLWFLGQAGYIVRGGNVTVAIDPYLSDSVAAVAPDFARQIPVPIEPEDLKVDLFIVTHDHLDHLDPETVQHYPHKETTVFVAPHLAARKLAELGVPRQSIVRLDCGESEVIRGVRLTGVFALATGPDVVDTTGYLVEFANGRSFYHPSDTAYCRLLLQAAPHADVLLVPINGKWHNLTVEEAIELTAAVQPQYVLPNHYDVMALNAESPETFRVFLRNSGLNTRCVIARIMEPFVFGSRPPSSAGDRC